MFPSDLQEEFAPLEEVDRYADIVDDEEEFLGHYVDVLEKRCSIKYIDFEEAVRMLDELFTGPKHIAPIDAACIRYIRYTLLSQIKPPF